MNIENSSVFTDKISEIGEKSLEALKNSGATDALINIGLSHAVGPLAKPINEATGLSEGISKKAGSWFDDLSYIAQQKYAKEHEDSEIVKEAKKKGTLKTKDDDEIEELEEPEEIRDTSEDTNIENENLSIKELPTILPEKKKRVRKKKFSKKKRFVPRNKSVSSLITSAIVLSDVQEILDDALKALYTIMYYSTDGAEKLSSDIIAQCKRQWEPALIELCSRYKVPKLALQKLLLAAYENAPFSAKIDDLLVKAGAALNSKKASFEKDTNIQKIELGMLKAFISYFKRNSETALNYLEKNLSKLQDTKLNLMFSKLLTQHEHITPSAQVNTKNELQKLVKKLTGKSSDKLTPEQLKDFRVSHPEQIKLYNTLRRNLNSVYKEWIKNYVRKSGQQKVDYQKLFRDINKSGIENNLSPDFIGYIDDQMNYYTKSGNLIDGKPVGEIRMNPNYDSDSDNAYVFKLKTPMGESTYYTVNYKSSKVGKKFETVNKLEDTIDVVRKKWLKDLRQDNTKNQLLAAQLELMYKYGARSGRNGNETAGEATFGITTLLVGHIGKVGNGFKIKYKGKKGAEQIHILNPNSTDERLLIKIISRLMEGKTKKDNLWELNGKEIKAASTLRYLKTISGISDVKLHYVRHMMGTKLARSIMKKSELKKGVSQAKAEAWFKEAMKEVGEALAHTVGGKVTGLTSIRSYISPKLQQEFFINLGLRIPTWIPKTKD